LSNLKGVGIVAVFFVSLKKLWNVHGLPKLFTTERGSVAHVAAFRLASVSPSSQESCSKPNIEGLESSSQPGHHILIQQMR
jgi:hypothetical protein